MSSEFPLGLNLSQDIRSDQEEQVGWGFSPHSSLLAAVLWDLLYYQDWDEPTQVLLSFVHSRKLILFLAQPVPAINIDAFRLCIYKRWKLGELLFTNLVIFFGMVSPLDL